MSFFISDDACAGEIKLIGGNEVSQLEMVEASRLVAERIEQSHIHCIMIDLRHTKCVEASNSFCRNLALAHCEKLEQHKVRVALLAYHAEPFGIARMISGWLNMPDYFGVFRHEETAYAFLREESSPLTATPEPVQPGKR